MRLFEKSEDEIKLSEYERKEIMRMFHEFDTKATSLTNQIIEENKTTPDDEAASLIGYYVYLNLRIGKLEEWLPALKGYKKLAQEFGKSIMKKTREVPP